MNSFVPSGTATPVPSGTRSSCYRGPESLEIFRSSTACRARNFPNLESFGFFLTDRAFSTAGDRHQRSAARRHKTSALILCWSADHETTLTLNQFLTNTPIRQYDFVFGDTRMHASARPSARSSSSLLSKVHRHTKQLRKSHRGELANPESFGVFPTECAFSTSGHRQLTVAGEFTISALFSRSASCGTALTLSLARFSARQSSNEGAAT